MPEFGIKIGNILLRIIKRRVGLTSNGPKSTHKKFCVHPDIQNDFVPIGVNGELMDCLHGGAGVGCIVRDVSSEELFLVGRPKESSLMYLPPRPPFFPPPAFTLGRGFLFLSGGNKFDSSLGGTGLNTRGIGLVAVWSLRDLIPPNMVL